MKIKTKWPPLRPHATPKERPVSPDGRLAQGPYSSCVGNPIARSSGKPAVAPRRTGLPKISPGPFERGVGLGNICQRRSPRSGGTAGQESCLHPGSLAQTRRESEGRKNKPDGENARARLPGCDAAQCPGACSHPGGLAVGRLELGPLPGSPGRLGFPYWLGGRLDAGGSSEALGVDGVPRVRVPPCFDRPPMHRRPPRWRHKQPARPTVSHRELLLQSPTTSLLTLPAMVSKRTLFQINMSQWGRPGALARISQMTLSPTARDLRQSLKEQVRSAPPGRTTTWPTSCVGCAAPGCPALVVDDAGRETNRSRSEGHPSRRLPDTSDCRGRHPSQPLRVDPPPNRQVPAPCTGAAPT